MGIRDDANKTIYKLKQYKEYLNHIIKNKRTYEDEENINTTFKYLFDQGFGYTYSKLFDVGNSYMNFISSIKITDNNKKTRISKDELLRYSENVLESIDPSLVEGLNNFKLDDAIIYVNKIKRLLTRNNISSMSIRKNSIKFNRKLKYNINIKEDITYETIKTFIHEYMHFISGNNVPKKVIGDHISYKKNIDEQKYGEFISIYFEEYAKDYMVNRFEKPNDEFDNTFRLKDFRMQEIYRSIYLPFKIYNAYNEYNYENYRDFVENNDIDLNPSFEGYMQNKERFLKSFSEVIVEVSDIKKKKEEHPSLLNDRNEESLLNSLKEGLYSNNYALGTLLAFYVKDKVTPKEMLRFARMINKEDKVDLYKDPLYRKIDDMYEEIMDGNFDYNILLDYLKKNDNIEKGVNYGRN